MTVLTPRTHPYLFWNHVWGLRAFDSISVLPSSPNFPFFKSLTWLIWDKRDTTVQSAARTASLMIRRWERLPGASRPQYSALPDIWHQAKAEGGLTGVPFWPATDWNNQMLYQWEGSVYWVGMRALIRSFAFMTDAERDAVYAVFDSAEYAASGGATILYFCSVPDGPGQYYEISAVVLWESGGTTFDYNSLDRIETEQY